MGRRGNEGGDSGGHARALTDFREAFYDCLPGWADALFELCDAVLCSPSPVHSVPGLSLEPAFRRSHGSLYKALARGAIDIETLRRVLVAHRPAGWPPIYAVDASTWDRCDAETSPERGFYYSASKHSAGQPIVAGWSYQWVCQLGWAPDSWTAPVDARRIPPTGDATSETIAQVRGLARRLGADSPLPTFVFDAGYDPIGLSAGLADARAAVLTRIRSDRVFYADPPERTNHTMGRPRRHGARFACADPATWPPADATLTTQDSRYGTVCVQAWDGLHPRLAGRGRWAKTDEPPIVRGTVIRVNVEHLPKPTARANKTLWLWWSGPGDCDLDLAWRAYLRRFDIEHTYRFAKNTLGWTTPALRTPEQADRWTWLVIAAYTQLRLAHGLVADHRLPWERPREPDKLTPARVRRGFRRLHASLGTPASPPKSDTPGPGRPKGTRTGPRTRHPAIKKAA
jgi:DDE superfamily endonuclease